MVDVVMLQLATDGDAQARLEDVESQLAHLPASTGLVLLPELWPVGAFDVAGFAESAQPIDGEFVSRMSDAARAGSVWLHAGSFVESRDQQFFNTSVLFDDTGGLVAVYRKIHLFGFGSGEADILSEGSDIVVVETPLGITGLSTCYDLRFPELYREQRDRGAEVFLIPTGWPLSRISTWRTLTAARAVENQAWLFGCNSVGGSGGVPLGGESVIVGPDGSLVAEGGRDAPEALSADVDGTQAAEIRERFPVHDDRRIR
jgi:predicted amidohydrolase